MNKRRLSILTVMALLLFAARFGKTVWQDSQHLRELERRLGNIIAKSEREKAEMLPLEETIAAAEKGDTVAQTELGKRYEYGIKAPKDKGASLDWYRKAAALGHAEAQAKLGDYYYFEKSLPETERLKTAMEWYEKAAEGCSNAGQAVLFHRYRNGTLGQSQVIWPTDPKLALDWGRRAARNDHGNALAILGLALMSGDGVPQDKIEGLAWRYVGGELGLGTGSDEKYEPFEKAMTAEEVVVGKTLAKKILGDIAANPCKLRIKYETPDK